MRRYSSWDFQTWGSCYCKRCVHSSWHGNQGRRCLWITWLIKLMRYLKDGDEEKMRKRWMSSSTSNRSLCARPIPTLASSEHDLVEIICKSSEFQHFQTSRLQSRSQTSKGTKSSWYKNIVILYAPPLLLWSHKDEVMPVNIIHPQEASDSISILKKDPSNAEKSIFIS